MPVNNPFVVEATPKVSSIAKNLTEWVVEYTVKMNSPTAVNGGIVRIFLDDYQTEFPVNFVQGINTFDFRIQVRNVNLWWPRTYGEQNLYNITFILQLGENIIEQFDKGIYTKK